MHTIKDYEDMIPTGTGHFIDQANAYPILKKSKRR